MVCILNVSMTKKILRLAQSIDSFAFDAHGCIFPNTVWEGVQINGRLFRPMIRHYSDGQGISLMRSLGIRICIITSEKGASALGIRTVVKHWNKLPSAKSGQWEPIELHEGCYGEQKLTTLKKWLKKNRRDIDTCGAMGDDLVDAALLQAVAFPVAPSSAEESIKRICLFTTNRAGGIGAVRDLANLLCRARGIDPLKMSIQ
jgi:3-deoxy-D-manno-octulosonate 8-phosphate phosphatase (KDO 8-P phosphatase)